MDSTPARRDTRFKPGHNARAIGAGRKPGQTPIADLLRKMQLERTDDGKTFRTVLARKIWDLAIKGEEWAVKFIADRTEGKVKDVVDMNHGLQPVKSASEMTDDELGAIIARAKPVRECPPD